MDKFQQDCKKYTEAFSKKFNFKIITVKRLADSCNILIRFNKPSVENYRNCITALKSNRDVEHYAIDVENGLIELTFF